MLIRKPADIKSSEITPKELYMNRREFIKSASAVAVSAGATLAGLNMWGMPEQAQAGEKLPNIKKSPSSTDEKKNSFKDITSYNNFFELGIDKGANLNAPNSLSGLPASAGSAEPVRERELGR